MLLGLLFAYCLTGAEVALPDDPVQDLRPGFSFSCRVRFAQVENPKGGWTAVVRKGSPSDLGAYWLRVSRKPEMESIDFFVNAGDGPEPRVRSGLKPVAGKWYDLAAGWDGTNAWLSVDGKVSRVERKGVGGSCPGALAVGGMVGEVEGLVFADGGLPPCGGARVGFALGCDVTFPQRPDGETVIATEREVYLLRYDRHRGRGNFGFFVKLDGSWEPRLGLPVEVETGRTYRVVAGWDGIRSFLSVDGQTADRQRSGAPNRRAGRFETGDPKRVKVGRIAFRNECRPRLVLDGVRSRELMPVDGRPFTVLGEVANFGTDATDVEVLARAQDGVRINPPRQPLGKVSFGETRSLAWKVDVGTNAFVDLSFVTTAGGRKDRPVCKRLYLMPEKEPAILSRTWNPPVRATRTWHVDAEAGDDARDGLTPATAWRTFRNANGKTLGPGERILLKRGSVFREELRLSAAGSPDNWAEIGAYGEGMRPTVRRGRMMDERCLLVEGASCLAVRDLIVCNAGAGLCVWCEDERQGNVLVERCLAHHIEGLYRFNAHGIPEWRDSRGPEGRAPARSCGVAVLGRGRGIVMRDCEAYQCSSGCHVSGSEAVLTRLFCHDNYAHNTSPHPYNTASRAWMTDCLFDASGWHASAGTMGVMLAANGGLVIRNCHFLNQPDSGSPDQGCIDFETRGDNCLIDRCTFRHNAGAPIEVLGLKTPQARNTRITRCRFDRNNFAYKNGPGEISVWGGRNTSRTVACSNGLIDDNGYVLVPGVAFYHNESPTTNDWKLVGNRAFDFSEELDRAYPWGDPPAIDLCPEVWTDRREAALAARVRFNPEKADAVTTTAWEQLEGRPGVSFRKGAGAGAVAVLPGEGDYRVALKADDGTFWRTARTTIHVLPAGARTFRVWDFSRNLDAEGWRAEGTGTAYEYIPETKPSATESFPVQLVCGDYYVVAVRGAKGACLVTPETQNVGVSFQPERANRMRIRLQNRTNARRMRLWWKPSGSTDGWRQDRSVCFDVKPDDPNDALYDVGLPAVGTIRQLKLSFGDGEPVTGTVRIDYLWLGNR